MKIEADRSPEKDIEIRIYGKPGDQKQPVSFFYFNFAITPAAAKRLAAQLVKLTGGAA